MVPRIRTEERARRHHLLRDEVLIPLVTRAIGENQLYSSDISLRTIHGLVWTARLKAHGACELKYPIGFCLITALNALIVWRPWKGLLNDCARKLDDSRFVRQTLC
jgi:hypothetical protein